MKNETVVYWSVSAIPELISRQNLFIEPPMALRKDIMSRVDTKAKQTSYQSCKSMQEAFKNTYMLKQPFDIHWDRTCNNDFIHERDDSAFKDSLLVDCDLQWFFFSEDSVEMEVTPPYLHNTEVSKYGFLTAGSFDISKWFRTVNLTYQLWEGIEEFNTSKNEAAAYINFRSPNKIILKQFELNEKLMEVANGCTAVKNVISNLPLNNLYERFTRSNRHKIVLKEIQANLLD